MQTYWRSTLGITNPKVLAGTLDLEVLWCFCKELVKLALINSDKLDNPHCRAVVQTN